MTKTILVAGNTIESQDAPAVKIAHLIENSLPGITFIPWDPTENLPEGVTGDIVIMDTVIGIQKITIFRSLDNFPLSPRNTVHDFDLPVALGLLQKIGKIKHITIIGIPASGSVHIHLKELTRIFNNLEQV